jgi:hypothetical protein
MKTTQCKERKGKFALYSRTGRLECWSNDLDGLVEENHEVFDGKGILCRNSEETNAWPDWLPDHLLAQAA